MSHTCEGSHGKHSGYGSHACYASHTCEPYHFIEHQAVTVTAFLPPCPSPSTHPADGPRRPADGATACSTAAAYAYRADSPPHRTTRTTGRPSPRPAAPEAHHSSAHRSRHSDGIRTPLSRHCDGLASRKRPAAGKSLRSRTFGTSARPGVQHFASVYRAFDTLEDFENRAYRNDATGAALAGAICVARPPGRAAGRGARGLRRPGGVPEVVTRPGRLRIRRFAQPYSYLRQRLGMAFPHRPRNQPRPTWGRHS